MLVAVVVATEVGVVVMAEVVARIISVLVTVGRGGDYLDTSSGSSCRDYFGRSPARSLSC